MKVNLVIWLLVSMLFCCKKSDFLSAKPDDSLVVPETLEDFQAFLDNTAVMNGTGGGLIPSLGQAACDDYYALESFLNIFPANITNMYTWNDDIGNILDWDYPYRAIMYANIVLDGLSKIKPIVQTQPVYDNIKGSALFYRAHMLYHLAQIFSNPFDASTASVSLGIPIRSTSDVNETLRRGTLQDVYDRIIVDLKEAGDLLPEQSRFNTRPSKASAYGLLSRIYLLMENYENSLFYSNACLSSHSTLIDYNDLSKTSSAPFNSPYNRLSNPEIIFNANLVSKTLFAASVSRVDSLLYNSYNERDLRRSIFFSTQSVGRSFKGSYDGSASLFGGIAVDEIYLIRAESKIRLAKINEAVDDLNALLLKRWEKGFYRPLVVSNQQEILKLILDERRKELVFRGLRWIDLRRLNKNGAEIVVTRLLNGKEFKLLPNDKRYTFLIPSRVMGFNPLWSQNSR